METDQKIKILAETKTLGITKLIHFGGSYGVTLPKLWVDFNAVMVEGDYYCRLQVVDNTLIFSPITSTDLEAVTIREKE